MDAFAASTPALAAAMFCFRGPDTILRFDDTIILQLFLSLIVDHGRFSGAHGCFRLLYLGGEIVIPQSTRRSPAFTA